MTSSSIDEVAAGAPIALGAGEGEALWFLGALATFKASGEATAGRFALIDFLAPRGRGTPTHVHHQDDEWWYVTEGELTFWVGGQKIDASAGSFVYGPRDIPHSFTVASEQARFLLGCEPSGYFDAFMREVGEPAARLEIPPEPTEPPDAAKLGVLAERYGMEILGPPGIAP